MPASAAAVETRAMSGEKLSVSACPSSPIAASSPSPRKPVIQCSGNTPWPHTGLMR